MCDLAGGVAAGGVLLGVPRRVGHSPRADHAQPLLDGRDREASVPVRKQTLSAKTNA